MHSLEDLVDAERKFREVLELADAPPPDRVEYGEACIRFFWSDRKAVVIVDLD
jgi:hypothetical protein